MGMKSKSAHFASGVAGGPSTRTGFKPKVNLQFFAKMPKQRAQVMHIMGKRAGHLANTPKNQRILEKISSNHKNYIGKDKHGNKVYSKIIKGKEYWAYSRNGIIQNGGSNGKNYKYHKKGE